MDRIINFNASDRTVRIPFTFDRQVGRAVDFPVTFRTANRLIYIPLTASLPIPRDKRLYRIGELDVLKIVTLDPNTIPDVKEE